MSENEKTVHIRMYSKTHRKAKLIVGIRGIPMGDLLRDALEMYVKSASKQLDAEVAKLLDKKKG